MLECDGLIWLKFKPHIMSNHPCKAAIANLSCFTCSISLQLDLRFSPSIPLKPRTQWQQLNQWKSADGCRKLVSACIWCALPLVVATTFCLVSGLDTCKSNCSLFASNVCVYVCVCRGHNGSVRWFASPVFILREVFNPPVGRKIVSFLVI